MYWEKCKINYFVSGQTEFVKITGLEVLNNSPFWVYISKESFVDLQNGIPIYKALKEYNLSIRDFLVSGFAPTISATFLFERSTIKTAFITNAVADSVVFYAKQYLNNKGLTDHEVINLRQKYSLSNYDRNFFTNEELKSSFINQSVFFMNLYKEMNTNDNFYNFALNLEIQNKFNKVFQYHLNFKTLKKNYNRRIFHHNLECDYMRSDYQEETFHRNTGVFSEKLFVINQDYYAIDSNYLTELSMRLCKKCIG